MEQKDDSTTLFPLRFFKAHGFYLTRLLISPDVKALATCSADHTVKIWKIDQDEQYLEKAPQDLPTDNETGTLVAESVTLDGTKVEKTRKTGPPTFGRVIRPAPFPDATAGPSSVMSVPDDFPGQKPLPLQTTLDGHQRWVWDCAFSADSAYLVSVSSDHYARLWELASAQIIRQYGGHHRGAVCVALNDYSEAR